MKNQASNEEPLPALKLMNWFLDHLHHIEDKISLYDEKTGDFYFINKIYYSCGRAQCPQDNALLCSFYCVFRARSFCLFNEYCKNLKDGNHYNFLLSNEFIEDTSGGLRHIRTGVTLFDDRMSVNMNDVTYKNKIEKIDVSFFLKKRKELKI